MAAIHAPGTSRPSILAPSDDEAVGLVGTALRLTASMALRSFALIAIATLLILIVLPAVLVAAAQAASAT